LLSLTRNRFDISIFPWHEEWSRTEGKKTVKLATEAVFMMSKIRNAIASGKATT